MTVREKQKSPLPLFTRDKALKTLCGTTLACPSLTETAAQRLLTQADAITGITRPNLLASSFSRRLQGDFHSTGHAALHPTGSSLCFPDEITLPFPRQKYSILRHHITFCPFVNGFEGKKANLFLKRSFFMSNFLENRPTVFSIQNRPTHFF